MKRLLLLAFCFPLALPVVGARTRSPQALGADLGARAPDPALVPVECTEDLWKMYPFRMHLMPKHAVATRSREGKGPGRCLPAWFETDSEAEVFFGYIGSIDLAAGVADALNELKHYNTLISFGSGSNAVLEIERGSGFRRACDYAEEIRTQSANRLWPYIDAKVLPDLDGSYRLFRSKDKVDVARNVLWKRYYKAMIAQVTYMVFRIDKFWLSSANCWEELTWVRMGFRGPMIFVIFSGNDDNGRSIWERAHDARDSVGNPLDLKDPQKIFDHPTPYTIKRALECIFHGGMLHFAREGPPRRDRPVTRISRMRMRTPNTPKRKSKLRWLRDVLKVANSEQGKRLESQRKRLFLRNAAAGFAADAAWSALEDHFNGPSPPLAYEAWSDEEGQDQNNETQSFGVLAAAYGPSLQATRKPSKKEVCALCGNPLAFLRAEKSPKPRKSEGRATTPTPRQNRKSQKGKVLKNSINLAQKAWAAQLIGKLSFDVCQKKPSAFGWGETCESLPAGKVYNHNCGFFGRYCAKDIWGCAAKHSMNLMAMAGAVPAFGTAFKAGRMAFKVGRKVAMVAFRKAVKKAAKAILGKVKSSARELMSKAFIKRQSMDLIKKEVVETTMESIIMAGAIDWAAKIEQQRNSAAEWLKEGLKLLDPIGVVDLVEEMREEGCADIHFDDMPEDDLTEEECHDCVEEEVLSGPIKLGMTWWPSQTMCLAYDPNDGTVHVAGCTGLENQEWYFDGVTIKTRSDDKCLDFDKVGIQGSVYMHDCHGGDHQHWRFDGQLFRTRHDENCIGYSSEIEDVDLAPCTGDSRQKWLWEPRVHSGPIRNGVRDKCLDYATYEGGNSNVQVLSCHEGNAFYQKWYFDGQSLKTRFDHRCLDYNYGSGNVYISPCHGEANQQWYFEGGALKSMYNGELCLDVDSSNGGHNVVLQDCQDQPSQQWHWDPEVSTAKINNRILNSRHDHTEPWCLDNHQGVDMVFMQYCHSGDNQEWYFEGKALKTKANNKCLDYVSGYNSSDPKWWGDVLMNECDGSAGQQWYWEGEKLKTEYANNCLDYAWHDHTVFMNECSDERGGQYWKSLLFKDEP